MITSPGFQDINEALLGASSSVNYWPPLLPTAPKFLKRVVCTNCPQICSLYILLNPFQSVFQSPTKTALVKSIVSTCSRIQESALGSHMTFVTTCRSSTMTHILHSSSQTTSSTGPVGCPHNKGVGNGREKRRHSHAFVT